MKTMRDYTRATVSRSSQSLKTLGRSAFIRTGEFSALPFADRQRLLGAEFKSNLRRSTRLLKLEKDRRALGAGSSLFGRRSDTSTASIGHAGISMNLQTRQLRRAEERRLAKAFPKPGSARFAVASRKQAAKDRADGKAYAEAS